MYIQLVRESFTDTATEGKMFLNGTFECYTLEDADRQLENSIDGSEKVYGRTAIPRGKYDIELSYSPHFGKILPHIKNVPYFEGIRIHSGNTTYQVKDEKIIKMDKTKEVLSSKEFIEVY